MTRANSKVQWGHPATASMRWLFPFLRHTGASLQDLPLLAVEGVNLSTLSLPQTRISHSAMVDAMCALSSSAMDPALGIRATEQLAPGDFDLVESTARTAPNLRAALSAICTYLPLLHGGLHAELRVSGSRAAWTLTPRDDVAGNLAVASDYALAVLALLVQRHVATDFALREVRFVQPRPTDGSAHRRAFGSARLSFASSHDALVFDTALLDRPTRSAHAGLHSAMILQADAQLDLFEAELTVKGRVRRLMMDQLRRGYVSRSEVASRLATSTSSLHRRLAEEGTTYREQLDHLRRQLAQHYLADETLAIGEVGYLLGFREKGSFYKAFHRWFGRETPADTRKREDAP